jgi:hypothetical protein
MDEHFKVKKISASRIFSKPEVGFRRTLHAGGGPDVVYLEDHLDELGGELDL